VLLKGRRITERLEPRDIKSTRSSFRVSEGYAKKGGRGLGGVHRGRVAPREEISKKKKTYEGIKKKRKILAVGYESCDVNPREEHQKPCRTPIPRIPTAKKKCVGWGFPRARRPKVDAAEIPQQVEGCAKSRTNRGVIGASKKHRVRRT